MDILDQLFESFDREKIKEHIRNQMEMRLGLTAILMGIVKEDNDMSLRDVKIKICLAFRDMIIDGVLIDDHINNKLIGEYNNFIDGEVAIEEVNKIVKE